MHPVTQDAYFRELEKLADHEKEAIFETLRVGWKAGKGALLGGKKLQAPPGVYQQERARAVQKGNALMKALKGRGVPTHRARVKSPGSIEAGGHTQVPDDLLGMQVYGDGPKDVEKIIKQLKEQGVEVAKVSPHARPGYHGINIKGTYQGTPVEMQVSPSRLSNMGQQMEHSLGYKPATEAPRSNAFDRWFGKKVAPRMVQRGSWVPRYKQMQQAAV